MEEIVDGEDKKILTDWELTRSSGGGGAQICSQQTLDCHTTRRGGSSGATTDAGAVMAWDSRDDILEPTPPWRGGARMRGREGE
jgi:hypothetical protein